MILFWNHSEIFFDIHPEFIRGLHVYATMELWEVYPSIRILYKKIVLVCGRSDRTQALFFSVYERNENSRVAFPSGGKLPRVFVRGVFHPVGKRLALFALFVRFCSLFDFRPVQWFPVPGSDTLSLHRGYPGLSRSAFAPREQTNAYSTQKGATMNSGRNPVENRRRGTTQTEREPRGAPTDEPKGENPRALSAEPPFTRSTTEPVKRGGRAGRSNRMGSAPLGGDINERSRREKTERIFCPINGTFLFRFFARRETF